MNMRIDQQADVVIVGAGIGGSALADVLTLGGLSTVVLEKTLEHQDVVRGEWLSPWGVLEATELGLTEVYEAAGANRPVRNIYYDELMSREESESNMLDMAQGLPEQPLCLGHPTTCNLLNKKAAESGAQICRGVSQIHVTPGSPPEISFRWRDDDYNITPRWIVGADGRNGLVARQIGCESAHDQEHHLFSGMLVENAEDWPEDLQVIATEGDVNVLAFPQGDGRVRVYLGWPKEDRGRLIGPDNQQRFLENWQLDCIPHSNAIVQATPISQCITYPNYDAWIDSPVREGVVLIGDAAGRNDPIIGQGLSIAHRDVRSVRDAMLSEKNWTTAMFDSYVIERKKRMAKLRTSARLTSLRDSAFGEDGKKLRQGIHERIGKNPDLIAPMVAPFTGPESFPAEVFSDAFTTQIVGQPIWSDLP
jgi:2-polyprenyl-6-methoxyphenol hydroxylase-like FAD-dependent oxidoreductase